MPDSLLRFMKCAGPRTVTPWWNSCLACWRPWASPVLRVKLGNYNSFQRTINSESGPAASAHTHLRRREVRLPSTRQEGIRAAFWSPHLEKLVCARTHADAPETGSKRQIPRGWSSRELSVLGAGIQTLALIRSKPSKHSAPSPS